MAHRNRIITKNVATPNAKNRGQNVIICKDYRKRY